MAKLYKPLVLVASILLLSLLMQYLRIGSLQLSHVLLIGAFYLAGGLLAFLSPASQAQEL